MQSETIGIKKHLPFFVAALFALLYCAPGFAQKTSVHGTVTDPNGEPLAGVNIMVKGTTTGTMSDPDGKYSLDVPGPASVLEFSFVGFKSQDVTVGNQAVINVTLLADTESLDEVVFVGYGTQKKVTVTGSVSSVSGDDLKVSPTTNLSNGMLGRLPGVIGFQRSDEPGGGGTTIRIRGTNSIGSKDPLVVIDGVPDRAGGLNRIPC